MTKRPLFIKDSAIVWAIRCADCGVIGPSATSKYHTLLLADALNWVFLTGATHEPLCPECYAEIVEEICEETQDD